MKYINQHELLRGILLVGCAYEIIALTTKKVPTVTRILKTLGSRPYGKAALWLWTGYVSAHFLEPLDEPAKRDTDNFKVN